MPNYNSTSRTPFAKGGRVGLFSGSGGKKEKRNFDYYYTGPPRKKGDKKKKKEHEPYTKSKRVSRETIREAIQDIQGDKSTHGKVHSLKSSREDSAKRLEKIIKTQGHFPTEKKIKREYPERDKGWKKKKKIEQN